MPLRIICHDIRKVDADAIVHAANTSLEYKHALDLAKKRRCKSIAFPLLASGSRGCAKEEALAIATSAISDWLAEHDMDVSLVVFDKRDFALSEGLQGEVRAFINARYVDEREQMYKRSASLFEQARSMPPPQAQMPAPAQKVPAICSFVFDKSNIRLDEPFSATLLRLIDEKGKSDVEIYKRANLDRKLFSKIRTGKGYMPSKKTVVALAVALELSLAETRELLACAGFALSRSVLFDVIVEYFITRNKYDIYEINNVLFAYDQSLLGG